MKTALRGTALKGIAVILIFSCTMQFVEVSKGQSEDKWHDQSGELDSSNDATTWILAGVGIIGAGVAIWYLLSGDSQKEKKTTSVRKSEEKNKITQDSTSKKSSDTLSINRKTSKSKTE